MINSGDIVNYQSGLWLSQDYILKYAGITAGYLRVAKVRAKQDDSKSWQHTELLNRCYFAYNALPRTVTVKLSPLNVLVTQSTELHDDITAIVQAALISRYRLFLGKLNPELAKAAAVLHEASLYCTQNGISFNKSAFFEKLGSEVELQSLKYLPRSWRNLRDKVRDYAGGTPVTELVAVKNEGNSNRATYANNEQIKAWLVELGDSQKNFSYAHIWRKVTTICAQHAIAKAPSQRWVGDFLNRPETQFLIQQRFGANTRFNHRYRAYTPTLSALFAGDCWDVDGTRVNIIDHAGTWTDKTDRKRSGQKFLYIIAVRDVMSGHVLGWEYCYEESAQAIINAVGMAVANAGYLPYELRYDKFPGHNSAEWAWFESELQRSGVVMTQTVKAEGKAGIERWWGTLQSVFMSESDYYYGEGVKSSRRYAHRAKEYVQAMRQRANREGFNFDDATRETDRVLDAYINTPLSAYSRKFKTIEQSPAQLHAESERPNTIELEEAHFCYLFGLRKQVSIRNNMIMTQVDNATYYYAVDDVQVIESYTGVKLWNCFSYDNMEQVHLFDGENYLGTFSRITPAQQYGPDKDMRAVGKMKAIDEKAKAHRAARMGEVATELITAEEEAEVPISGELGVLQAGRMRKPDYEAAESAYLTSEWEQDDEQEITINTRKLWGK
ncbi:MAG: hypothetical protein ACK5JD_10970 [Mangrovibacterium sp.]